MISPASKADRDRHRPSREAVAFASQDNAARFCIAAQCPGLRCTCAAIQGPLEPRTRQRPEQNYMSSSPNHAMPSYPTFAVPRVLCTWPILSLVQLPRLPLISPSPFSLLRSGFLGILSLSGWGFLIPQCREPGIGVGDLGQFVADLGIVMESRTCCLSTLDSADELSCPLAGDYKWDGGRNVPRPKRQTFWLPPVVLRGRGMPNR